VKRSDATPYDGPCCRWCGAEVEEHEALCWDCLELAAECAERRRAALLLRSREEQDALLALWLGGGR